MVSIVWEGRGKWILLVDGFVGTALLDGHFIIFTKTMHVFSDATILLLVMSPKDRKHECIKI